MLNSKIDATSVTRSVFRRLNQRREAGWYLCGQLDK